MSTLLHRAKIIAGTDQLQAKLTHLRKIVAYNGFSKKDIDLVITSHGKQNIRPSEEDVTKRVAVIPYYSTMTNWFSCLLQQIGIETISCPLTKIRQLLRPVHDSLGLRVPGAYKIPCACGREPSVHCPWCTTYGCCCW